MRPPKGGPIGANGDEQEGVGAGRGAGACAEWAAAVGGRGSAAPAELSADEAVMEALPGGRGGRAEAPQRGAAFAPSVRGEVPREGVGAGAREVRRAGGRAFRSDASRRALGFGGRAAGRCRDVAAVDAGRRVVEPGAKATAASARALRAWIERYGVPMRVYVDWKNLYKRLANSQERLRGEEPITQS